MGVLRQKLNGRGRAAKTTSVSGNARSAGNGKTPPRKAANGRSQRGENYRPSAGEPFMSDRQLEYFREKLNRWRSEILRESQETLQHLQEDTSQEPDIADRASVETDRALELRTRDRQRKLISKIDAALKRIEDGTYGYCEVTGEPISLQRLDARPIATMTLEAQEMHEQREKVYRDD